MMKHSWLAWIVLLAATPSAAVAQPQRIEAPGTWVHLAAQAAFPEQVGEFRRVTLYRYDEAGANVSASYSLPRPGGRLHLTVYIYPSPRLPGLEPAEACRREYEESSAIILRQHGGAERIEEGQASGPAGPDGRRSAYRLTTAFDGREQEVRSELVLYCHVGNAWQVKYRATYPVAVDPGEEIERFIRTGPWPGRAAPERIAAVAGGSVRPAQAMAAR